MIHQTAEYSCKMQQAEEAADHSKGEVGPGKHDQDTLQNLQGGTTVVKKGNVFIDCLTYVPATGIPCSKQEDSI